MIELCVLSSSDLCLSACLSVCLAICLSVCLSVNDILAKLKST